MTTGLSSFLAILVLAMASGCATMPPPQTVERVDLQRFMGDWYVVGGRFTWFERDAYNALETYTLDDKGRIQTTYTLRRGSFDAPLKSYPSVAFVHNEETKAEWRIQFLWPFRFPYLVLYLDPEYRATAVGTDDRKYLWIMSRTPEIDEALYADIVRHVEGLGFSTNGFVRVPQQPLGARGER